MKKGRTVLPGQARQHHGFCGFVLSDVPLKGVSIAYSYQLLGIDLLR